MKNMGNRVLPLLALMIAAGATYAQDEDTPRLREEARRVSTQLMQQVRTELTRELERSGPIRAIAVCKYSAMEATSSLSRQAGAKVSRVSLRPRNPALGAADPWEQSALMEFDKRAARGEKAETLEYAEVVAEPQGRFFRYIRAIPTQSGCLVCHGTPENIPEGVKAQLAAEYPQDRATGYAAGQIRGGVVFKKLLP